MSVFGSTNMRNKLENVTWSVRFFFFLQKFQCHLHRQKQRKYAVVDRVKTVSTAKCWFQQLEMHLKPVYASSLGTALGTQQLLVTAWMFILYIQGPAEIPDDF
jgi:hypothetical protein